MTDALTRAAASLCRLASDGELADVGVAIVDMGGHTVALWRSPDIGFFYVDLASKAWSAAALRRDPGPTGARLIENPAVAAFLSGVSKGRLAPLAGGALLYSHGGPVGAIGAGGPGGAAADEAAIARIAGLADLTMNG